ncbi:50S ribosomal protein L18 [Desulfonema limicola]|uniref:Large ribosomal subunit protein uL18 n=1 Tax=Desulfonema limicola TaxID=45656 RepID=A0A975B4W5_9BACT|nr:50S ribosomal protein L18 [Desulfonema limicola]QTA78856.1 50S ribosomal protein L18 [Desulfonema limicola]
MGSSDLKRKSRQKRKKRIRKKMVGTSERPRLSVFKSAKHIYAQIVNDVEGNTLVAASSMEKDIREDPDIVSEKGKIPVAARIGKLIADRAMQKGVKKVVFDRNGFIYHGRIKAVSEGAREAGLDF